MKSHSFRLPIIMIVVVWIVIFSVTNTAAIAQTPTTTPVSLSPTPNPPTPDPTITSLQNVVATQQADITSLRRDLDYEVRDIRWWFLVAGVIAAITGVTGYQAYRGIDEQVRKKIRMLINKYYYQLDVTNLNIHIRKGNNLDKLEELLKSQGLYNVSWFEQLGGKSLSGVTIFSIVEEKDEKEFVRYIDINFTQTKRLNPKKSGFILYAPTGYRIRTETIDIYPTTAVANTPWNLVSTAIILGRHIIPPPNLDDEEDKN